VGARLFALARTWAGSGWIASATIYGFEATEMGRDTFHTQVLIFRPGSGHVHSKSPVRQRTVSQSDDYCV